MQRNYIFLQMKLDKKIRHLNKLKSITGLRIQYSSTCSQDKLEKSIEWFIRQLHAILPHFFHKHLNSTLVLHKSHQIWDQSNTVVEGLEDLSPPVLHCTSKEFKEMQGGRFTKFMSQAALFLCLTRYMTHEHTWCSVATHVCSIKLSQLLLGHWDHTQAGLQLHQRSGR